MISTIPQAKIYCCVGGLSGPIARVSERAGVGWCREQERERKGAGSALEGLQGHILPDHFYRVFKVRVISQEASLSLHI